MSTETLRDRVPLGSGAVAGAAVYVLGYILTYALTSGDLRESPLNRLVEFAGGGDVTPQLVGWLFYNAHFVPAVIDAPIVGGSTNFIAEAEAFSPVLYLIPVFLLVAAGLAVARRYGTSADLSDAALAGASVVLGYLPLALLGIVAFGVSLGESSGGPDPILAVGLAGVVYPVVFGAIGAVVAQQTS